MKISIIIPIYNGEKFIEKCIKSIKNQTFKDFEIILVNDGSSDNSGQICDELAKNDNRIKVIHQENLGVSEARNRGINASKGEYICFIDCDDYIKVNYLEELYNSCVDNNVRISICAIESIDDLGKVISLREMKEGRYYSDIALEELFQFRNLNWGPCGKLFHKSIFNKDVYFPSLHAYEDLIFCYKAIKRVKSIYFNSKCKYYYVHRQGIGAMDKFVKEPTIDVIKAAYEILSFVKFERPNIWDKSFYGIVSQVVMYINDINKIDEKWKRLSSKKYVFETKKLLSKYRKDLFLNKSILYKEKIMFIILSYSVKVYKKINDII